MEWAVRDRSAGIDAEVEATATRVIGAAVRVRTALGAGLPERFYAAALPMELIESGCVVERERRIPIRYRGVLLGELRPDMVVNGRVLVELKATESFHPLHRAQTLTYLHASSLPLALLINFNVVPFRDGIIRLIP